MGQETLIQLPLQSLISLISSKFIVMKRRQFIKQSALIGGAAILPWTPTFASKGREQLEVGLIADLHQDIMHDGEKRLEAFIQEAAEKNSDFIIQMGDFCIPRIENEGLMRIWTAFEKPSYHILGNHDTDLGYSKKQVMEFWGLKERYYSFDAHGYHFVVLDGNDENPKPWSGYHRFIGREQQEWLKSDLAKTKLSTFVFSHQTLENEVGGVANFKEIRQILESANKEAGESKVVASFSGHHHTDYMTNIHGIYYIQINSASYRWVGEKYMRIRYSKEIDDKYHHIKRTIPYKDPLYTFLEIDPTGQLRLQARSTEFVGPGPKELGMPRQPENDPIVPTITGFSFNF